MWFAGSRVYLSQMLERMPSDLMREGFLRCREWLVQKLQTDQEAENKCQWRAQPQMRQLCHTTTSQGSGATTEEGTERSRELALRKQCFLGTMNCYTQKRMTAVIACRPTQDRAS